MDTIKSAIEARELELAKEKILALEQKLAEEASPYTQSALKRQIAELKGLYSSKLQLGLASIELAEARTAESERTAKSKSSAAISGLRGVLVEAFNSRDAVLEDCECVETGRICCTGTLNLRRLRDSTVECHCTNLRVTDSRNVTLRVFTRTGVFLQNCQGVVIVPIPEEGNQCRKVFDFDCPHGSKNYVVVEEGRCL